MPPRSCAPLPSGLTYRLVATFFSVPLDCGMNCWKLPLLHHARIRPSGSGSEAQPPRGSDTQSPVPLPLGAYWNLTAPACVPARIRKCVAGSGWVAGHPEITVPGAACCWYTSNPLPDGLTSSPAVPSVGLPPLAVTVRVNVPVCTAPSASVAVTFMTL